MDLLSVSVLLLLCVCCILLALTWGRKEGRGLRLPPGPTPLPILGNFFQLDRKDIVKSLVKMSEVYGPVFTVYLGLRRVVVLCSYKVVKEALVDQAEEFSGRGQIPSFSKEFNEHGVVFAHGDRWRLLRRFSLSTLRNFGMGKRSIEERIQEEARCLVEELHGTEGKPFDPTFIVSRAVSNIICSIVFGNRFEYNDKKFLRLNKLITERVRVTSTPQAALYNIFPEIMEKIPGTHHAGSRCSQAIISFIRERIKMQQASLDPSAPQNYIDCFLVKMEEEKGNACSYFHMDSLVMSTHNLFFAGTETVSTTLRYGILVLMKYHEIAAKVQDEIGRVIGSHRSPTMADRGQMPYTDAVIHEIQRFIDVAPLGAPHAVIRDTNFRGYLLPKGTNIITFLYSVHKDPTQFKNPEMFDPTNFLDEKGEFRRRDGFMPFSAGKRVCLGESLARVEMFLFFTTLLQRFTFQPTCPPEQLDLSPIATGIGNIPPLYKFYAIPR
ncbi:cytochrome P450 2G1-like [Elgaria multicarinata webbii]|uniref:cytochrome P450 2G1-like n=1 Tax=Elgaria multicarinata webbii TaxID=159646 RepID=UPI002FCCC9A7